MTPLSLRFAGRELRSGVRGFRIFLACLALGVAAIAAAGSTAEAFRRGLASEAREILGGDLVVSSDRAFTGKERAVFERLGERAYSSASRAMAEAPSGQRRMVELRAVDPAYPLAGSVELTGPDGKPAVLSEVLQPLAGVPAAAWVRSRISKPGRARLNRAAARGGASAGGRRRRTASPA